MIVWFLLGSAIAYGLVISIYRLHIHPLSKFPGPRLAALTGLYEVFCTAGGVDSFDDEIDRMHQVYGPVVRITPDEVHVQDQFYDPNTADRWIKGTKVLDASHRQSGGTTQRFQIKKRSIWPVQSILQVEIHQLIRGLVRKHQIQRAFNSRAGPVIPITERRGTQAGSSDVSDLEDGSPIASDSARGRSISRSGQRCKEQLSTPSKTSPRTWYPRGFSGQAWYSTMQGTGSRSLPF